MSLKYPPNKIKLSLKQKKYIHAFYNDKNIKFEKIKCPLCNFKYFKELFQYDIYSIKQKTVKCNNCGLMYSNPRMDGKSARYFYESDLYRKIYNPIDKNNDFISRQKNELENFKYSEPKKPSFIKYYKNLHFDFICSQNLDFESIGDIGSGAGLKLMNFKFLGKKVFGIEPSQTYSKELKKYNINVKQGFIDDLTDKYDLVILNHVLEHLHNPNETIKKIYNITNKYLFIEVPGIINKIPFIQNAHNFYFSKDTLNYFVLSNGFKLINIHHAEDNNFILAIYQKSSNFEEYKFKFNLENKLVNNLYYKFFIKNFIIQTLKFFMLEKIFRKIWKRLKQFF